MATKNKTLAPTHSVKVVFSRKGNEMSTTAMSPIALFDASVWTEEKLAEKGTFCWNESDWRLVECNLYSVSDVTLPIWLSGEEWLKNHISWKYTLAYTKDGVYTDLDSTFLRWVNGVSQGASKLAMIRLMETKAFRSEFRKAMRDQILRFLETAPQSRIYPSPLSPRQMECIIGPQMWLEAQRIDSNVYRN